jgi:hypothetical protein
MYGYPMKFVTALHRRLSPYFGTIRALIAGAACGALVTFALMGGFGPNSSSTAPAQNAARGAIDGLRIGDPGACTAFTSSAQQEVALLLGARRSQVANLVGQGFEPCGTTLLNVSPKRRARAMAPFLGGENFSENGSNAVEWSVLNNGKYAVVTLEHDSVEGWLVSSIRYQVNSPSAPSLPAPR